MTAELLAAQRQAEDAQCAMIVELTDPAHRHRLHATSSCTIFVRPEVESAFADNMYPVMVESVLTFWCDVTDVVAPEGPAATSPGPR